LRRAVINRNRTVASGAPRIFPISERRDAAKHDYAGVLGGVFGALSLCRDRHGKAVCVYPDGLEQPFDVGGIAGSGSLDDLRWYAWPHHFSPGTMCIIDL
jgi:hypothetical protein